MILLKVSKAFKLSISLKYFFVQLISLLLISCGGAKQLPPLNDDAVILAFGDSLTVGVGVAKENSYPLQLSRLLHNELPNHKMISSGVSGEITQDGLVRLEKSLQILQPDLIILLEGGNDILRNKSFETIKNNLASMIELAQTNNIPIILIGVPKKSIFTSVAPFYDELADEYNLIYDGEIISDLIKDSSMKSDSVHFNQQGYQKLAERVYELIFDN